MIEQPRTLPLRVPPADGEALDSWLARLAHRNGIPVLPLARVLGFGDRLRVWHNYALTWRLPAPLLRRMEAQTGLPTGALDAAVLDQFDMLAWKPIPGSRYCPACLTQTGGIWPLRWQLPYTFACLAHQCLLAVRCPGCGRTPRSRISERSGLAPPTRCTLGTSRHSSPCDADLLTHRRQRLRESDPRLVAQAWVDERLDRLDAGSVTDLRDLDALAVWFRQRIHPSELKHLGAATVAAMTEFRDDNHAIKRHQPTAGLIAAAMTCHAIDVITGNDRRRDQRLAPLLRDVHTQYQRSGQTPSTRGPMILSHKRLTSLSEPLQHKVLWSIDSKLPITERLRYRTCTSSPRAPEPGSTMAGERARHIPQYLWPDWIIRFQPLRGAHTDDLAIDLASALLIPGNPVRNIHATGELNPWRNNISIFLSEIAALYPDALTALCNIAEYLDSDGAPIDYRRRRATFTDIELTKAQYAQICARADANPGRGGRLLHARRHLFAILTGADLTDRRHRLAFASPHERGHYHLLQQRMISALRAELHRHAAELLATAGIDEPVTWSPPAQCVAGLKLPGREPADIDLTVLHQLVIADNTSPQRAARRLGVTVEHVRYASTLLHRPAPTSKPRISKLRARADQVLTRQFFQREHVEAGKDLATLIADTGFSSRMLRDYARAAGIKIVTRAIKDRVKVTRALRGDRIDPQWLREQAGTRGRANTDIAAELGLSHETIRRYRRDYGIPSRPTGGHSHVVSNLRHPNLPRDIRLAVEGQRGGWQRLRRFQQMMAYPSMNTAAAALSLHTQNLNLQIQRLETDVGAPLLQRAPHRYAPMVPTRRGQRLLDHLTQPTIRELLDRYADANARPKCGPYKRTAQ
jgi:TniQ/Bacterial regulatory helix-turn-helix protein, lysR family